MLGAEQSGFIADLGYETYQKILSEAVTELKNDEFADLYADEIKAGEEKLSGEGFVDECSVESDLELLFPNEYIPSSSERMLLYRELDKLELDKDVEAFRARLLDRFGKIPPEGEELIRIVPLRRMAKRPCPLARPFRKNTARRRRTDTHRALAPYGETDGH